MLLSVIQNSRCSKQINTYVFYYVRVQTFMLTLFKYAMVEMFGKFFLLHKTVTFKSLKEQNTLSNTDLPFRNCFIPL